LLPVEEVLHAHLRGLELLHPGPPTRRRPCELPASHLRRSSSHESRVATPPPPALAPRDLRASIAPNRRHHHRRSFHHPSHPPPCPPSSDLQHQRLASPRRPGGGSEHEAQRRFRARGVDQGPASPRLPSPILLKSRCPTPAVPCPPARLRCSLSLVHSSVHSVNRKRTEPEPNLMVLSSVPTFWEPKL
jgi:hypothetical protein